MPEKFGDLCHRRSASQKARCQTMAKEMGTSVRWFQACAGKGLPYYHAHDA